MSPAGPARPIARARAKVNLTLDVGGRRADGFHELDTILLRLGLADRLAVRATGGPPTLDPIVDRLRVLGPEPCAVPGNLVLRATAALRAHAARPLPPLAFTLHKAVPVAAGLGGGSSDAAAAIELASRAWSVPLDAATRLALGASVGSDVPFFAADVAAARATGRGERVAPLPAPTGRLACLLAVVPEGLATTAVYAAFDALAPPRPTAATATARLAAALARGLPAAQLVDAAADLRAANELWPAVARLRPDLARLRAVLEQAFGRPWLLSGSGPTLFALYASEAEARRAVAAVRRQSSLPDSTVRLLVSGQESHHEP